MDIYACGACSKSWLIALETRINDVALFSYMDDDDLEAIKNHGAWPDEFQTYRELLEMGKEKSQFRFIQRKISTASLN